MNIIESLSEASKDVETPDFMFYIRVFEGCNAYCSHCFIPSNPKKMSFTDIVNIPSKVRELVPAGKTVMFQWHGGEPTVMGDDFIRKSIQHLNKSLESDYVVQHGIQTNLLSYNENWNDIFSKLITEGQLGVSWDPKIRHIRSLGINTDSNKAYNREFFKNLALLSNVAAPVVTITTTKLFFETFPNVESIISRFSRFGIREIHLERLTKTGYAKDNWSDIGVTNKEYSDYMTSLLRGYINFKISHPEICFNISPFDGLISSVSSLNDDKAFSYGCWSGGCDSGFHTIDANGYKSGCTALTSEIDNKTFSNSGGTISFMDKKSVLEELERRRMCGDCRYASICSTGCAALDFNDGSGECSGAKGLFQNIEKILSRTK